MRQLLELPHRFFCGQKYLVLVAPRRYYIPIREHFQRGLFLANVSVTSTKLQISLGSHERYILGRPNLYLDLGRIVSVSLVSNPKRLDLGVRITKRPLFGRVLGEYRYGSRRLVALGNPRRGGQHLKVKLSHPTIDEIWYFGRDAILVLEKIQAKGAA